MSGFPLLLIPLAVYNIIALLMRDVKFDTPLVTLPLPSGAAWTVSLSDALVTLGLFLLLLEVLKSARPLGKYVTDHLLALVIFAGAATEFVLLPQFATATFFLLTMIVLVDFLSGIGLHRRRARRDRDAVVATALPDVEAVRESPAAAGPIPGSVAPERGPINPEIPPARIEAVIAPRIDPRIDPRIEPIIDTHPERASDETPRTPGV